MGRERKPETMKKKILVISTSPRKGGNSETLAGEFARGASESGAEVEEITLRNKSIAFCRGCLACQKTKRCAIRDDAEEIVRKIGGADVVAFATPVYFYGMSGQMKTLLDRTNPLFDSDYAFRDVYLLAAAADGQESAIDGTVEGLRGWLSCFEKAELKGVVRGTGATDVGDISKLCGAMESALEMGRGA